MARAIDADAVLDRYYAEFEKQDICDGSQDRDWLMRCIEEAPTLTPPNEPMTCDGCVDCKRSSMSMCKFCIRNTELRDYYRRPPEGEEHCYG